MISRRVNSKWINVYYTAGQERKRTNTHNHLQRQKWTSKQKTMIKKEVNISVKRIEKEKQLKKTHIYTHTIQPDWNGFGNVCVVAFVLLRYTCTIFLVLVFVAFLLPFGECDSSFYIESTDTTRYLYDYMCNAFKSHVLWIANLCKFKSLRLMCHFAILKFFFFFCCCIHPSNFESTNESFLAHHHFAHYFPQE